MPRQMAGAAGRFMLGRFKLCDCVETPMTHYPRIVAALLCLSALTTLAAEVAPAAASAPRIHAPAPRTGPGGSTVGARHGGLVLDAEGVQVELDAQPSYLDLYLVENDKPLNMADSTGHITLLNGVDITDAYLSASADGKRLTIGGDYKLRHGTRVIVRVKLADGRRLDLRYLIILSGAAGG
jgi:hypothetical protein